jgi:hypothetical protein
VLQFLWPRRAPRGLWRTTKAGAAASAHGCFFVCPPEGGLGSSWLKHALKQRSPTALKGVVRAVVVLVLERVFVVGGEVVAATTRVGAGTEKPRPDLGSDQPGDGPSRDAVSARGSGRAAG